MPRETLLKMSRGTPRECFGKCLGERLTERFWNSIFGNTFGMVLWLNCYKIVLYCFEKGCGGVLCYKSLSIRVLKQNHDVTQSVPWGILRGVSQGIPGGVSWDIPRFSIFSSRFQICPAINGFKSCATLIFAKYFPLYHFILKPDRWIKMGNLSDFHKK